LDGCAAVAFQHSMLLSWRLVTGDQRRMARRFVRLWLGRINDRCAAASWRRF